ncbi:MAG: hypothetical protein PHS02_03845 [Candidatus ainarchaeum sp.]|nr:hypothetical protein [Candidatus ainarchaeum sp.]
MKHLLFLLLIFGMLYADTNPISDSIISYYLASKIENLNVTMKYTDTYNMTPDQIAYTRQLLTDIWSKYKVDYHVIKNLVIYQDGDYAIATYTLDTTVSGAENLTYTIDYIMLLHRVKADWLIAYAMPMQDYLKATDELAYASAVNAMLPNMRSSPSTGVKFNGVLMSDLNSSLQSGLNSCATDAYCASRGWLRCSNSTCTNIPVPVIIPPPNVTHNATSNASTNASLNITANTTPKNNTPPKTNITVTFTPPELPKNTPCLPSFLLPFVFLVPFAYRLRN